MEEVRNQSTDERRGKLRQREFKVCDNVKWGVSLTCVYVYVMQLFIRKRSQVRSEERND